MKIKLPVLVLIILLAAFLRFYQLGRNPPSLDWDEASLGYNAYSILKTGADEYGNRWPISFRSFGDFKPPLYIYLTVPSVAIFGLNEFSVRFPSAVAGLLTVLMTYFLVKELSGRSLLALLSSFFLAISPWHLQFSRVAFEANVALLFFVAGTWLFLKGLKDGLFFLFSFFFFLASLYTYHSPRLVVPLFLLGLLIYFRKELLKELKWLVFSIIFGLLLLFPFVKSFQSAGTARFSSVTSLSPESLNRSIQLQDEDLKAGRWWGRIIHNRRFIYLQSFVGGYLDHFNFDFLFLKGDAPGRHHAVDMGMLYLLDFPFILAGIYCLIGQKVKNNFVIFWWFLVAPVASALTSGTPHAVRSLLYLPTYQIFTAYGILRVYEIFKENKKKIFLTLLSTFYFLLFTFYLDLYYVHTSQEYSQWWQYGYKDVVEEVSRIEKDYGKVITTYRYDQPHIYFLFYQKVDPAWYQKNWGGGEIKRFERSFGKYEFRNIDWEKDKNFKNVLIVGTPQEIPEGATGLIKEVKFLDGQVAFRIVAR